MYSSSSASEIALATPGGCWYLVLRGFGTGGAEAVDLGDGMGRLRGAGTGLWSERNWKGAVLKSCIISANPRGLAHSAVRSCTDGVLTSKPDALGILQWESVSSEGSWTSKSGALGMLHVDVSA